jgi:hypothetical protein
MDESGSVSAEDWVKEKKFVKDLSGHFKFGPNAAQLGVISFSTNADLDIQLNSNTNLNSFQRAVDKIWKPARESVASFAGVLSVKEDRHYTKNACKGG